MPSPRRLRLLMVATLVTVVLILFYTSGKEPPHDVSLKDFYQRTKNAMDRGPPGKSGKDANSAKFAGHVPADRDGDGDVDEDDKKTGEQLQERLKAVEQEAKDKANEKAPLKPDTPSKIIGVGSSRDGQKKNGDAVDASEDEAATKEKATKPKAKEEKEETKEEHAAEVELNSILKKSPVIIFSKTYCPYSKRAKELLLKKYAITPDPYVVELDEHAIGSHLQDYLLTKTGRRTVPNILINGISIGGADDISELDKNDKLVAKIKDLGQRRVQISRRSTAGSHH